MRRLIHVAAMLVPLAAFGQVYKCEEGGKVVYSQQPCGQSAKELDIRDTMPSALTGRFADDERRRTDYLARNPGLSDTVATAIKAGVVVPGMTEDQVIASMGEPIRRNLSQTAASSMFQWVYLWPSGKQRFVYFEDGVVVATN